MKEPVIWYEVTEDDGNVPEFGEVPAAQWPDKMVALQDSYVNLDINLPECPSGSHLLTYKRFLKTHE